MKIHLMCGIPGSGKSTMAKEIQTTNNGFPAIVCPDVFRMILTGQEYYAPAEDMVWSHVKTTARVLLKERDIIVDATNTTPHARAQWLNLAKDFFMCDVLVHAALVPLSIVKTRNESRERIVPNDVIEGMARKFKVPSLNEGFQAVLIYNKNLDIVASASLFDKAYGSMYRQFVDYWTFPYNDEAAWSDL